MRVGLVVPHMFMHREILPNVIFSPADLALALADGLTEKKFEVFLYTPGPVNTNACNITADLSLVNQELEQRGYGLVELLKKHPQTFVSLARQVQAEVISKAYQDANNDKLDILHVYTNEEELAIVFASLSNKPVVFSHHDPFSYLIKYKSIMPKYSHLPWISFSMAQRANMPSDTNWLANIYHGLEEKSFDQINHPTNDYIAYMGRIIEPKGLHLLIKAIEIFNKNALKPLKLKIAGKHYSGHSKDSYWNDRIKPYIDNETIIYEGYINNPNAKHEFVGNAAGLVVPSLFDEPFGLVSIEALANGTPVIGLDSGALPEVIEDNKTGFIVPKVIVGKSLNEDKTAQGIAKAIARLSEIERDVCRDNYKKRFTRDIMIRNYIKAYKDLIKQ